MGITNPGEEYFKDGTWGWDGSVWRKLPMVWGYSDVWVEYVTAVAVGAGNATAVTAVVPAGYVYVVQMLEVYHNAAAAKEVSVYPFLGGVYCSAIHNLAANPWVHYTWNGTLALKAACQVYASVVAPGDGKAVYLRVWGYKMKVA